MLSPSLRRARPLLFFVGCCFLYVSNGSHVWAIGPWVALPCFLLVTRQLRPWAAYGLMALTFGLVTQASLWHFSAQDATQPLHYVPLAAGLVFAIPYALDALAFRRQPTSGGQTLLFPLAYTCLEYLASLVNPFGSMGTLPYSQFDFLALAQLASVTGIWGITFLITWFGSMLAYAVSRYVARRPVGRVAVIYGGLWLIVVAAGSWRLAQSPLANTVRVAGIHVYDHEQMGQLYGLYDTNQALFRAGAERISQQLIAATRQQAKAGAQVVVWSEVSPMMLPTDEPRLLASFKKLALEEHIYLVVSPFVCLHPARKDQNKLWLIDPTGKLLFTHIKYGGNLLEGCELGNGQLQVANTPLGRLSGAICWDGDFPQTIRQVSALDAGLLLIPASDWQAISPLHTVVAQFRGIENGCSVVRQTVSGRSVMADQYGRVITQMDHFVTNRWVMQGQVPTRRVATLYGFLGDWFAWICLAGLAGYVWQGRPN